MEVKAEERGEERGCTITASHDVYVDFWKDIAEQPVIEPSTMEQNKRHLQQRCRERRLSTVPATVALEGEYGMNEHVEALFDGSYNP